MTTMEWRLVRWSMVITTVLATLVSSFILTFAWSLRKHQPVVTPREAIVVPADKIGQTPQKTLLR
ncbi:MAG: hypothetical protein ACM3ZQ_04825 [Bacillota bacterium]